MTLFIKCQFWHLEWNLGILESLFWVGLKWVRGWGRLLCTHLSMNRGDRPDLHIEQAFVVVHPLHVRKLDVGRKGRVVARKPLQRHRKTEVPNLVLPRQRLCNKTQNANSKAIFAGYKQKIFGPTTCSRVHVKPVWAPKNSLLNAVTPYKLNIIKPF